MDCILHKIKKVKLVKNTCTKAFHNNAIRYCKEFVWPIRVEGKGFKVKKQCGKSGFFNVTESSYPQVQKTVPVYQIGVEYQVKLALLIWSECKSTLYK